MIEDAPDKPITHAALEILLNGQYSSAISKINESYLYWDKVKYQAPKGLDAQTFWNAVKFSRRIQATVFHFSACTFFLKETQYMQERLHEFDMNFGGTLASSDIVSEKKPPVLSFKFHHGRSHCIQSDGRCIDNQEICKGDASEAFKA